MTGQEGRVQEPLLPKGPVHHGRGWAPLEQGAAVGAFGENRFLLSSLGFDVVETRS